MLELIAKVPGTRMLHYASVMRIPKKTLERWSKQLREENKIEFRGAAKTGGYFIIGS